MDSIDNETVETIEDAEVEELDNTVSENSDEGKRSYPTQVVLTIRMIVGIYVFYLAYQIVTAPDELSILMWAFVVLFFIAGAGLAVMSVKHFICGEYEGGKKDV